MEPAFVLDAYCLGNNKTSYWLGSVVRVVPCFLNLIIVLQIGGMNQSVPPPITHHPVPGISPNTVASFYYDVPQTGSAIPGKWLQQGTVSVYL